MNQSMLSLYNLLSLHNKNTSEFNKQGSTKHDKPRDSLPRCPDSIQRYYYPSFGHSKRNDFISNEKRKRLISAVNDRQIKTIRLLHFVYCFRCCQTSRIEETENSLSARTLEQWTLFLRKNGARENCENLAKSQQFGAFLVFRRERGKAAFFEALSFG